MGARKWVRGEPSQGPVAAAPAAATTPHRRGPRKLVWQRQPGTDGGPRPVGSQQAVADGPAGQPAAANGLTGGKRPVDSQQDTAEQPAAKRQARAGDNGPAAEPSSTQPHPATSNPSLTTEAKAREDAARQKQADMQGLQRMIQQKQAELRAQLSGSNAAEAQRQQQKARDKARLDAGFSEEFRRAQEASVAATAQQQQEVQRRAAELDDVADVARVLASKSHLECLQLRPGASRADVKAKYHGLARLLHPDKCKANFGGRGDGARWYLVTICSVLAFHQVPRATDAFQRLVQSYQALLATTA